MSAPTTAEQLFAARFGGRPVGVWSAPGRMNLIGEHTDYTGGLVLPFAIDARASVAIGPNSAGEFRVASVQRRGDVIGVIPEDLDEKRTPAGWSRYPLGVLWALRDGGADVPPLDIALSSAVPAGAGLSSSAAVECAVALAVSEYLSLELDQKELARLAQRAENDFVGMPCGLMDQMASTASRDGHALYFDIGRDVIEQIPFDPAATRLALLTIDTHAHHSLADGEYAKRRADCEAATATLGVDRLGVLREADLPNVLSRLGGGQADVLVRRVTHVVTENERVRDVVGLLRTGAIEQIGPLLSASHASLRDDFEVSCVELDLAASTAEAAGALGARMVGGGFGGSVLALACDTDVAAVEDAVIHASTAAGYRKPTIRPVVPKNGAHRDW